MFAVYDLLVSPDCLPDLLQGGLKNKNVNDVFILTTFQVQNKAPVRVFRIYNPTDNTDHFDFTVHGKLNKGIFAVSSHYSHNSWEKLIESFRQCSQTRD